MTIYKTSPSEDSKKNGRNCGFGEEWPCGKEGRCLGSQRESWKPITSREQSSDKETGN